MTTRFTGRRGGVGRPVPICAVCNHVILLTRQPPLPVRLESGLTFHAACWTAFTSRMFPSRPVRAEAAWLYAMEEAAG